MMQSNTTIRALDRLAPARSPIVRRPVGRALSDDADADAIAELAGWSIESRWRHGE